MIFSDATVVNRDSGALRLEITCTLSSSYPNFRLTCATTYTDVADSVDGVTEFVRGCAATIKTSDGGWRLVFSTRGWNDEMLIEGLGTEENQRLELVGQDPVQAIPAASIDTNRAFASKKYVIGSNYDLIRIESRTKGFYQVKILIPVIIIPCVIQ